jgi:hypothetical protein
MGFYESYLYDSDTEYYINETLKEDDQPEMEIDWIPYTKEVSQAATELLEEYCVNDSGIIKSMKYKNTYSPKYYNYDTDRLNIIADINIHKLKAYIKQNKTDFNQYLKDNFTSYDGFWSFIENNYPAFMEQYKSDKDRCLNVMLEYYILRQLYGAEWLEIKQLDFLYETPYHQDLFNINNDAQWNNLKEVQAA